MAPIGVHRSRLGAFRTYWLATVVCIAAFMQGYDSGVAGGVLTMKAFQHDYHYTDKTRVNSFTVGLQQLGSFLACFVIFWITSQIGRKKAIAGSAAVFLIGCIIETIITHSLAAWYVGRILAGLGQGGISVVVPTFLAEMAAREIRGRIGTRFQWM